MLNASQGMLIFVFGKLYQFLFAGSSTLPRTGRVMNGTGMVDKVTAATSSTSLYDNVTSGTGGTGVGTGVSGTVKQSTGRQTKDRETTTASGKVSGGAQSQNVAVGTGSQTDEVGTFADS